MLVQIGLDGENDQLNNIVHRCIQVEGRVFRECSGVCLMSGV